MSEIRLDFQSSKPYSTKGTLIVFGGADDKPLYSDTLDIANSKKRKDFIKQLTQVCEAVESESLEQAILEKVTELIEQQRREQDFQENTETDPLQETPQQVKDAALKMLKSDELFARISDDIEAIGIAGEERLRLLLYIIMTSRLLDKPLSGIVQGASASGKSYIIETVAKLMPPEAVLLAHDFSDQALYYLPQGSLIHKAVISGERVNEHRGKDGFAEDNTKAFREMVASGQLRKAVTVKGSFGAPETVLIIQPGPISYLESSTAANIHDEDATRLLPLVTDESPEQTKRIIEAQRQQAKGYTTAEGIKEEIIQRHRTLQRLLRPLAIRIPYIDSISLPETNIATRRTYQQFKFVINSVAFLRQYQKQILRDPKTGQEYIEADEIDYAIVFEIMNSVLARTYSPLNQQSRDLLNIILKKIGTDTEFTQKDCEQWSGLSNTTVRRRLNPLASVGIVKINADQKPYKYTVTNPELAESANLDLPTPQNIKEVISERNAIIREQEGRITAHVC